MNKNQKVLQVTFLVGIIVFTKANFLKWMGGQEDSIALSVSTFILIVSVLSILLIEFKKRNGIV